MARARTAPRPRVEIGGRWGTPDLCALSGEVVLGLVAKMQGFKMVQGLSTMPMALEL